MLFPTQPADVPCVILSWSVGAAYAVRCLSDDEDEDAPTSQQPAGRLAASQASLALPQLAAAASLEYSTLLLASPHTSSCTNLLHCHGGQSIAKKMQLML